jgi:hypothetical protein
MYSEFYSGSGLLIWPFIGLFIFLASFAGVLLYVFIGLRDEGKRRHLAELPLQDDLDSIVDIATGDIEEGKGSSHE